VLDRFAAEDVEQHLDEYRRVRAEWQSVATELVERTRRSREMAREAEMLKLGLTEIKAVDPQPGEDDSLIAEARRLADADQLRGGPRTWRSRRFPAPPMAILMCRARSVCSVWPGTTWAVPRIRRCATWSPGWLRPPCCSPMSPPNLATTWTRWRPIRPGWSRCWRGRPS